MLCVNGQALARDLDMTAGHLFVRNTFLEFFDDSTALGPYENDRRPRIPSDRSDERLPAKVEYQYRGGSTSSPSPPIDTKDGSNGSTQSPANLLSVLEAPSVIECDKISAKASRTSLRGQAFSGSKSQILSKSSPHSGTPTVTLDSLNSVWASTQPMVFNKEAPPSDLACIAHGAPTTIMLRNIPNRYSQNSLIGLLDDRGFACRYDFVYLPMDFRNGVNLGYAFVNFAEPQDALGAMEAFNGFTGWFYESSKVCEVSWSHPHQGLEEHVERYRNSPVMHHCMPDEYKPMIFNRGVRAAFPPPTKAIRAPKLRPARERPSTNES